MSEVFHKNFYTTRSAGYKYRTLSTNTQSKFGDLLKIKEDGKHVSIWDKKISELRKAILAKVCKEASIAEEVRDNMSKKFEKIDAKVDSMLELQNTVLSLRKDLSAVGTTLVELVDKVNKMDAISAANSFQSRKTYRTLRSVLEEQDEVSIATYLPTNT
ncbi:unnamed protein product [Arctia plantaginis]|uniref:Uncharacterized protein n=1 Tax=Arctia plantaginis TaxID=874455 RepID=A0A8S1A0J5_ARCPL|nr:unnamed protein product [Arctia plantaginis]CAB3238055.1 unnamed protein product [Arctia plantaginis]